MHLRHRDFGNLEGLPLTPARRVVGAARRARVFLGVVVCAAAPATAAAVPGATVFAGGAGEIGADFALTRLDSDLTDVRGDRYALRGGLRFSPRLQWEGEITRATVREDLIPGAEKRVTFALALVNLVVNFHPRKNVDPYLLAGIGLGQMKLEAIGLSSRETATAYQIAGGSRFFFGGHDRVAVRIEASLLANEGFDERYVHATLGAGLTFSVGK